ncbi:metal ABC transporter ATP-binding protein [Sedimentibacter sp.]|uniref:metal ABC transporter ATP-binding protein n=1 Tax=Sedimentibacter sp. TaxID=1960295 RepID=UPI0028A674E2|nr:metal ABC transporter ATP-binding protein [Sedimentibacter sp.]
MTTLIRCENLNFYYDRHQAVKDVSFCVNEGDYLSIVGENGSGKSTLMKGLLGLKSPSSGEISFNGIKQTQIGYLPQQNPVKFDFPASVYEVVLSGCLSSRGLKPFYGRKDKLKVVENMEKLGISSLSKTSYRDLSGGQQQRILLARALCATEKLLLLDEPVAGLDPLVTSELYQLIEKLNKDYGVTIIMISHDILSAVKYSNIILHMNTSSLFFGPVTEYKETAVYKRMIGGNEND